MGNYNFESDLKASETIEKRVADFLASRGATEIQFNHDGRFDLSYLKNGKWVTLEIKEDQMFDKTGNIAVEVKSRGKASGICSSIADYWCYVLGTDLLFCKRSDLIYNIISHKYRNATGGDNNTSYLVLIPVPEFEKLCDVISGGLV